MAVMLSLSSGRLSRLSLTLVKNCSRAGRLRPGDRAVRRPREDRGIRSRLEGRAVDKFAQRRSELAAAALQDALRAGLRPHAACARSPQNSEFSHGVLHYYFRDKVDLITHCVREYKAQCVTRYDQVVATASTAAELAAGFLDKLAETLVEESALHRLWYDLRAQSMFEESFRADVAEIDASASSG